MDPSGGRDGRNETYVASKKWVERHHCLEVEYPQIGTLNRTDPNGEGMEWMTSDKSNLWRWNNLRISTGKWYCIKVQKKTRWKPLPAGSIPLELFELFAGCSNLFLEVVIARDSRILFWYLASRQGLRMTRRFFVDLASRQETALYSLARQSDRHCS